jgi:predicted negative regulator of RcsB-dependent stress response
MVEENSGVSMEFETEEQKIEALKKWWQENGKLVIAGIILGGALIAGWRFYHDYKIKHAEQASALYETVLQTAEAGGDINAQQTRVNELMAEYTNTPYAALSALVLAKQHTRSGDNARAIQQLEWVIKNSSAVEIQNIARLRMARLMMATEQYDAAMSLVNTAYPESFTALFEELKGDLYVRRGETELARAAYDKAILASENNANEFLKLKRDDLGQMTLIEPAL